MVSPEAPPAAGAAGLVERLRYAGSLTDACYLLLEHVLRLLPADRAVVVVRAEGALRGAAYGIDERRFGEFLEDTSGSTHELREWIDAGEARARGGPVEEIGMECSLFLPFPGPRGIPSGALLLDADASGDALQRVKSALGASGPTLTRIAETEVLREALRRAERRSEVLDSVVNGFADPVVLTDGQNNFLFANRRAESLLYAGPDESEGRRRAVRVNDLLFSSFLTQAVIGGSGEGEGGRELNLVDPSDGSDLLFEVLTLPLPEGVVVDGARISILRDITDLKRAVSELEVQFNRSRVAERSARIESRPAQRHPGQRGGSHPGHGQHDQDRPHELRGGTPLRRDAPGGWAGAVAARRACQRHQDHHPGVGLHAPVGAPPDGEPHPAGPVHRRWAAGGGGELARSSTAGAS